METSGASCKAQDEQLVIVLHINEGESDHNFTRNSYKTYFLNSGVGLNPAESILIQATLSGNKLVAEPIKPGHTTLFNCNLVWETDRKSIKR